MGCARIQTIAGEVTVPDSSPALQTRAHYSDVLRIPGPPSSISTLADGYVFLYQRVEVTERQWGLILIGTVLKYLKAVSAKTRTQMDLAIFVFDQDGLMVAEAFDSLKTDAGGGFSFTLFFKLQGLSATEEYIQTLERNLDWGMALTRPLPQTLNREHGLDFGIGSIEVVPTGGVVGQSSLEMGRSNR